MRVTRTTLECDACGSVATFDGDQAAEHWSVVSIVHAGTRVERDVCPACVARLLDPPEDLTPELVRFARL